MPRISQKMLTEQSRELEGHSLVTRTVYAEVPPRAEYATTRLGESLRPVITAIGNWGLTHGDKITGSVCKPSATPFASEKQGEPLNARSRPWIMRYGFSKILKIFHAAPVPASLLY
jgi:hypothetical protein